MGKSATDNAIPKLKKIAKEFNGEFRIAYSGRFMYGAHCVGIDCERYDVEEVKKAARRAGIRAAASQDSMGMGAIVYWPTLVTESRHWNEEE